MCEVAMLFLLAKSEKLLLVGATLMTVGLFLTLFLFTRSIGTVHGIAYAQEETDPEKEGHKHENEEKRRWDHRKGLVACKSWGYCFPAGHDPDEWREYLPEGTVLHACPKKARCHPKQHKQLCGKVRAHCDQSCREQCCFCCGSP